MRLVIIFLTTEATLLKTLVYTLGQIAGTGHLQSNRAFYYPFSNALEKGYQLRYYRYTQ